MSPRLADRGGAVAPVQGVQQAAMHETWAVKGLARYSTQQVLCPLQLLPQQSLGAPDWAIQAAHLRSLRLMQKKVQSSPCKRAAA